MLCIKEVETVYNADDVINSFESDASCMSNPMSVDGTILTVHRAACVAARFTIMDEIHDRLDAITVDWETLAFDQVAGVVDNPNDGWADRLHPGSVTDGTFVVLPGSFTGTCEAKRP